eukprot:2811498-Pyramimonas_sp.AAC.1
MRLSRAVEAHGQQAAVGRHGAIGELGLVRRQHPLHEEGRPVSQLDHSPRGRPRASEPSARDDHVAVV